VYVVVLGVGACSGELRRVGRVEGWGEASALWREWRCHGAGGTEFEVSHDVSLRLGYMLLA
jgi:hypothetical protein